MRVLIYMRVCICIAYVFVYVRAVVCVRTRACWMGVHMYGVCMCPSVLCVYIHIWNECSDLV
jgi:hypothetical protein